MADNEPVIAPDQLKPGPRKSARIGVIASVVVLLLFLIGNHEGNVENVFIIVICAMLLSTLVFDAVMRRNGLK